MLWVFVIVVMTPVYILIFKLSGWLQKPFERLLIWLGIAEKIKYWE